MARDRCKHPGSGWMSSRRTGRLTERQGGQAHVRARRPAAKWNQTPTEILWIIKHMAVRMCDLHLTWASIHTGVVPFRNYLMAVAADISDYQPTKIWMLQSESLLFELCLWVWDEWMNVGVILIYIARNVKFRKVRLIVKREKERKREKGENLNTFWPALCPSNAWQESVNRGAVKDKRWSKEQNVTAINAYALHE